MRDHDRDRDFGRELENESKGLGEQVGGKVKEEVGDLTDNKSMEIEGKVEKNVGKVRRGLSNPTDSMSRDWDEDKSGVSGGGSMGSSDRSSDVESDRLSGNSRSGSKDRSGY